MTLLGIDLGGTKVAGALFNEQGIILLRKTVFLAGQAGHDAGKLVTGLISDMMSDAVDAGLKVDSIGISVPGISNMTTGTVWAPNIPGWSDYPLLAEAREIAGEIPVLIDSDRACHILGEVWKGNAKGCRDAVFLAVGTGIGAGIIVNGEVLRGNNDIAGAIGWMALDRPYNGKYKGCGCFEYHASGVGLVRIARELMSRERKLTAIRGEMDPEKLTARDIFVAYESGDSVASEVIGQAIEYWGMAVANLVSLFNPEKIILGGGIFGPAAKFINEIRNEASKWAQPVSITRVSIEVSSLRDEAAIFGAGFLALRKIQRE